MPNENSLVTMVKRLRVLETTTFDTPVMVTYAGDPNAILTAREGTFCWDTTNHVLYLNTSATEGTTWCQVACGQAAAGGGSAAFVQNSGNIVNDASTFDGYTLAQVVQALRDAGVLA